MSYSDLSAEFVGFLYHEAHLMEQSEYRAWLDLWDDECLYWVPLNEENSPPEDRVSLIYEDRPKIEMRVERLCSGPLVQTPPSRMMRSVTNVVVDMQSDNLIRGTSQFILGEVRYDEMRFWMGRCEHLLIRKSGQLRIRRKKVVLLNNNMTVGSIGFLL